MDKQNKKICAVVVTYNRKKLLLECLNSLINQEQSPDCILVVDNNSIDNTLEYLFENNFFNNCKELKHAEDFTLQYSIKKNDNEMILIYIKKKENDGGAGGFNYGIRKAIELNYDWLWLMDDDGLPARNALSELVINLDDSYAALSCMVVSKEDISKLAFALPQIGEKQGSKNIINGRYITDVEELVAKGKFYPWASFFNGVLINSKAIKKVGNVNKRLFIWGDEVDYLYRLSEWGGVLTCTTARHYHPKPANGDIPLWKRYYGFRNRLYINRKYRDLSLVRNLKLSFTQIYYFLKEMSLGLYFKAYIESKKLDD